MDASSNMCYGSGKCQYTEFRYPSVAMRCFPNMYVTLIILQTNQTHLNRMRLATRLQTNIRNFPKVVYYR